MKRIIFVFLMLMAFNLVGCSKNELPSVVIDTVESQDKITFDMSVIDDDSVIDMSTLKAVLYKDGTEINSIQLSDLNNYGLVFNELLSNNEYEIEAEFKYDLNDGNGLQLLKVYGQITTLSKVIPTAIVKNVVVGQEEVTFDVNIVDVDSVIDMATLKAVLYKDGTVIETIEINDLISSDLLLDGLLTNNEYKLQIEFIYYLNDDNGYVSEEIVLLFKTEEVMISPVKEGVLYNIVRPFWSILKSSEERHLAIIVTVSANKVLYSPHFGVSFQEENTEEFDVVSVFSGEVIRVESDTIFDTFVVVEHNHGVVSYYYSVKDVQVSGGDYVSQGDVIGVSSTSLYDPDSLTHVHFELKKNSMLVDPELMFGLRTNQIETVR